jgi:cell division transport system permease protein
MSGSFDKFQGRPGPPGSGAAFDPYDVPLTGAPGAVSNNAFDAPPRLTARTIDVDTPTLAPGRGEAAEPSPPHPKRSESGRKMKVTAPVVPPGSVTGRSLTLVIAIMCFLASLTAGSVWMINESSNAWLRDIASEVTVQIEPQANTDTEKTLSDVISYLAAQPGIAGARGRPRKRLQRHDARRPQAMAAADTRRHALVCARRHRDIGTRRRSDDGDHRLGDAKRDGV